MENDIEIIKEILFKLTCMDNRIKKGRTIDKNVHELNSLFALVDTQRSGKIVVESFSKKMFENEIEENHVYPLVFVRKMLMPHKKKGKKPDRKFGSKE